MIVNGDGIMESFCSLVNDFRSGLVDRTLELSIELLWRSSNFRIGFSKQLAMYKLFSQFHVEFSVVIELWRVIGIHRTLSRHIYGS